MKRSDDYRLQRIIEVGEQLANVIETDKITRESILNDFHTQWLICSPRTFTGPKGDTPFLAQHGLASTAFVMPEREYPLLASTDMKLVGEHNG